ncbi:MAG: hypothetical protein ACOCWM_04130, partial [Cyclobacteriaceae bacterium]
IGTAQSYLPKGRFSSTRNIKQLGFSGLLGFSSRASILVGGQERSPKTQPFHIAKRCVQV